MQVQDSYGSNQQITWITKLWELKCLEYLYLQVPFVSQVFMSEREFIIKSFHQVEVFLKQQYKFQIFCSFS